MMLSSPKLKVIHVTTHIGLLDAVAQIEPGLVERTMRRGHDALVRSGNPHPKIGLCGINPHAGENGLFGYGEEDLKIVAGRRKRWSPTGSTRMGRYPPTPPSSSPAVATMT